MDANKLKFQIMRLALEAAISEVDRAHDRRQCGNAPDWTPWLGGELPNDVSEHDIVEVMHRAGGVSLGMAGSFLWEHWDVGNDLIAYRLSR